MTRTPRRLALVAGGSTLALVALTGVASAHVTVSGPGARQGGYATLVFSVPTEKGVPTTSVTVTFPSQAPFASVSPQAVPGWTVSVTRATPATPVKDDEGNDVAQVVTAVTWKATSPTAGIQPDQFQQFLVSAGPLPKAASVAFPTTQGYADGSTVAWDEPTPPGGAEPEQPAPTLELAASSGDSAAPASPVASVTAERASGSTSDGTARGLGIAGIVVGVLGLAAGAAGVARGRRTTA